MKSNEQIAKEVIEQALVVAKHFVRSENPDLFDLDILIAAVLESYGEDAVKFKKTRQCYNEIAAKVCEVLKEHGFEINYRYMTDSGKVKKGLGFPAHVALGPRD